MTFKASGRRGRGRDRGRGITLALCTLVVENVFYSVCFFVEVNFAMNIDL